MMIEIDGKIISSELFRRRFVCDISRCKGICCYEGDAGAPLEDDELERLTEAYPAFEPLLTPEERAEVQRQGLWVRDQDGDLVTPIIDGHECVFSNHEADGTWTCAIEKAYLAGKTTFRKPISCYLYPIRISKYNKYEALNFHEWDVCQCALELGAKTGTPAYRFLREPIIAKYGEDFFAEMEKVEEELRKAGMLD